MVDVKHHNCNIFILIVVITTLVHELCLDLDDAVEGLVGDECLVPGVQLQQSCRVGFVNHSMKLSSSRAGISQVKKLTAIELQALRS